MNTSLRVDANPPKDFRIGRREHYHTKLIDALLTKRFVGKTLNHLILDRLTTEIVPIIDSKQKAETYKTVRHCCSCYSSKELTDELLEFLCEFLAANRCWLTKGKFVSPDVSNEEVAGWAPLLLADMEKVEVQDKRLAKLKYDIIGGNYYGKNAYKLTDIRGPRMSSMFWKTGINSRRHKEGMPRDLVGLYMFGRLYERDGEIRVNQLKIDDYLERKNKELISDRRTACPRNYLHSCAMCHVGYLPENVEPCHRAPRPLTITIESSKK